MARLAHWEVERMLGQMQAAARPGSDWAGRWGKWQGAYGDRMVWVEFPLGELMNPAIAGFVWAWAMQKRLVVGSIQEGDEFNAQGLEGKVRVRTTLSTALLVYRDLPPYRCQVVMEMEVWNGSRNGNQRRRGDTREASQVAAFAALVGQIPLG